MARWQTRWIRSACKEMCSRTDKHMKHAKVEVKEWHAHATSSEHQVHQRLYTPFHAEVKLWYTKSTSITQQHCSSTYTPPPVWTYQLCRVESCHESSQPHHYYGPHYCNQCNVTWKSKRPTCKSKKSCKVEDSCKSNSHEGIRTITRVSFTLGYKYPSFIHAKDLSPWFLPHNLESV